MLKYALRLLLISILILIIVGCGSGDKSPVSPSTDNQTGITGLREENSTGSNNSLWGMWDILVDVNNGTVEAVLLRGAMFNANVVKFLQPPVSPINMLTLMINPGSNLQTGYLDVDVTIRHPFFGFPKLRGFDVHGIVMGEGTEAFSWDSSATRSGTGELQLLNADGYTRWWNPSEFTTYGTILGYTKGNYASSGYTATATINPYKYFADGLDKNAPVIDLDISQRGTFGTEPGINKRNYLLQFPVLAGGGPVYHFNYAVDASWALPSDDFLPEYPVEAYPPQANMQEAWLVTLDDAGSTAWYVDDTHNGGSLNLAIEVFDWQSAFGTTVPDEVASIWVESPVINGPVEISGFASPAPSGPVSSVWNVEISDLSPASAGMFECWIGVEAAYPEDYSPAIDGDPGMFDWPDKPLTAFFTGQVTVLGTNPIPPPEVILVNPPDGLVSTVITDVQVIGNNFIDGALVDFSNDSGDSLVLSNVIWQNPTLITCDIDCDAPLGMYDVTVTNPDLQFDTLFDGFEIIEDFVCEGSAHDWANNEYNILGLPSDDNFSRFDMAILKRGTHAGMLLYQMSTTQWGILDPEGGPGQTIQSFMTTPNMRIIDVETSENTDRITIISSYNSHKIIIYDEEGIALGDLIDPDLDPADGYFLCMDFAENGDLWAATRTKVTNDESDWELRHYRHLEESPYYEPLPDDTVDLNTVAMTGPLNAQGIGDIGISFYLNRLFIFTANTSDGGSNKLSSWDLNQSPPALLGEFQNPFPPFTRHHIFGNGSLSRMDIDVDHRFPEDKYEQCRIYIYANVWVWTPQVGVDCYVQRLDGDMNILDTGEIYHPAYPAQFDKFPQCVILDDYGPGSSANLLGSDWLNPTFTLWPVPSDW